MNEEHTIDSLPLPHILLAVQDGETQFSFYFRDTEREQPTGIFGISLYEIGIEADITCRIRMEDLRAFYYALRRCCEGTERSALLADTQEGGHIRLSVAFDNAGHAALTGFVRNIYSGNASVVHFSLQCDQIDFLAALSRFEMLLAVCKA